MAFLWKSIYLAAVAGTRARSRDVLSFCTDGEARFGAKLNAENAQIPCLKDWSGHAD